MDRKIILNHISASAFSFYFQYYFTRKLRPVELCSA